MEKKKIAILGAGNMGSAIAASLAGTEYAVTVTAATSATLRRLSDENPWLSVSLSNAEAAQDADIVVIAVKPYVAPQVIAEIRSRLRRGAAVVSVVAGYPLARLAEDLGAADGALDLFRVIPNTAIRLGKSATFIAPAEGTAQEALHEVERIFSRSGKVFTINEKDMGACCALSSCGIAYFLRFIRAAVEGSVELGLRPGFATEVAAATAEGAAALLAGGSHPEAEIDKVTTPGGLTIKGLNALDENGFNKAVIAALKASCKG